MSVELNTEFCSAIANSKSIFYNDKNEFLLPLPPNIDANNVCLNTFIELFGEAAKKKIEEFDSLLMRGANINCRSGGGSSLHIATERENLVAIVFLVERGINLNILNRELETAAAIAQRKSNFVILDYLVLHHKPVDLKQLSSMIDFCIEYYEDCSDSKDKDRLLLDYAVSQLAAVNIDYLRKMSGDWNKYIGHLRDLNVEYNSQSNDELEKRGWSSNRFLALRIRSFFEIVVKIEKRIISPADLMPLKLDSHVEINRQMVLNKLKTELLVEIEALFTFTHCLFRCVPEIIAKNIYNKIMRLSNEEEYSFSGKWKGHAVYVGFVKYNGFVRVRVDNLGDGSNLIYYDINLKKALPLHTFDANAHVHPCLLKDFSLDSSGNSMELLQYINNIVTASSYSIKKEKGIFAFYHLHGQSEGQMQSAQHLPSFPPQTAYNCAFVSQHVGVVVRLNNKLFSTWLLNEELKVASPVIVIFESSLSPQVSNAFRNLELNSRSVPVSLVKSLKEYYLNNCIYDKNNLAQCIAMEDGTITDAKALLKIFDQNSYRIFIGGDPGVGKSTFCKMVVQEWVSGRLHVKWLFFISLYNITDKNYPVRNKPYRLEDIVKQECFPFDSDLSIQSINFKESAFVIDGLDEVDDSAFSVNLKNALLDLFKVKNAIFTSRSFFDTNIQFDKHFTLTGFSSTSIEQYVKRYFLKNNDASLSLLMHINKDKYLAALSSTPLFLRFICDVYASRGVGVEIENNTSLYQAIIEILFKQYAVDRSCNDNKQKSYIFWKTSKELEDDNSLLELLAFIGLQTNSLIIDKAMFSIALRHIAENQPKKKNNFVFLRYHLDGPINASVVDDNLILAKMSSFARIGIIKIIDKFKCNFVYASIQGFFAARYVAHCIKNNKKLIRMHHGLVLGVEDWSVGFIRLRKVSYFDEVWKFVAGLLVKKTNHELLTRFFNLVLQSEEGLDGFYDVLLIIKCLLECGDKYDFPFKDKFFDKLAYYVSLVIQGDNILLFQRPLSGLRRILFAHLASTKVVMYDKRIENIFSSALQDDKKVEMCVEALIGISCLTPKMTDSLKISLARHIGEFALIKAVAKLLYRLPIEETSISLENSLILCESLLNSIEKWLLYESHWKDIYILVDLFFLIINNNNCSIDIIWSKFLNKKGASCEYIYFLELVLKKTEFPQPQKFIISDEQYSKAVSQCSDRPIKFAQTLSKFDAMHHIRSFRNSTSMSPYLFETLVWGMNHHWHHVYDEATEIFLRLLAAPDFSPHEYEEDMRGLKIDLMKTVDAPNLDEDGSRIQALRVLLLLGRTDESMLNRTICLVEKLLEFKKHLFIDSAWLFFLVEPLEEFSFVNERIIRFYLTLLKFYRSLDKDSDEMFLTQEEIKKSFVKVLNKVSDKKLFQEFIEFLIKRFMDDGDIAVDILEVLSAFELTPYQSFVRDGVVANLANDKSLVVQRGAIKAISVFKLMDKEAVWLAINKLSQSKEVKKKILKEKEITEEVKEEILKIKAIKREILKTFFTLIEIDKERMFYVFLKINDNQGVDIDVKQNMIKVLGKLGKHYLDKRIIVMEALQNIFYANCSVLLSVSERLMEIESGQAASIEKIAFDTLVVLGHFECVKVALQSKNADTCKEALKAFKQFIMFHAEPGDIFDFVGLILEIATRRENFLKMLALKILQSMPMQIMLRYFFYIDNVPVDFIELIANRMLEEKIYFNVERNTVVSSIGEFVEVNPYSLQKLQQQIKDIFTIKDDYNNLNEKVNEQPVDLVIVRPNKRKPEELNVAEQVVLNKAAKILTPEDTGKVDFIPIPPPPNWQPLVFVPEKLTHNIYYNKKMKTAFWQPVTMIKRDPLYDLDKVKVALAKNSHIPPHFQLGAAIGAGDCFFDAVAQGLNARGEKADVKSLRILCDTYAKDSANDPAKTWVEKAVEKDGGNYPQYLMRIGFTADEMAKQEWSEAEELATWGRIYIEGRMICQRFNIKLHLIEIHEENHELSILEQRADSERSYSIEPILETAYEDADTIHLVLYHNHFVPLLPMQRPNLANSQQLPTENNDNSSAFQFRG